MDEILDYASLKDQFNDQGYLVIDSGLDEGILDNVVKSLGRYFGDDREPLDRVPFADHGRIQDAWHINTNVFRIATNDKILKTLRALYGEEAKPFQTLNFAMGTEQPVHSDSIHFNSEPFGAMCGVWTALEDIGEEQGPLIYYPGSQKLAEMNYQDLGLEANKSSYPAYLDHLQKLIEEHQFKPEYGILKKGQCLIWSANILHGGSKQIDKSLTRHSQVTHYYVGSARAWRPVESQKQRYYFNPPVVRDMTGLPNEYPQKISLGTRVQSKLLREWRKFFVKD